MINKRVLLVEVRCTLISLNFYLFQNNFASIRSPKWVLLRLKRKQRINTSLHTKSPWLFGD